MTSRPTLYVKSKKVVVPVIVTRQKKKRLYQNSWTQKRSSFYLITGWLTLIYVLIWKSVYIHCGVNKIEIPLKEPITPSPTLFARK